jgi:Zn-dependent M28 family amino/carboxypeptidase
MTETNPKSSTFRIRRVLVALAIVLLIAAAFVPYMTMMPGKSARGPLPPLSDDGRALASELERDVRALAHAIGERNVHRPKALSAAERHVESSLRLTGLAVARQEYAVEGVACVNFSIEIAGRSRPTEIVVIGAHYDSVVGSPGANDNASGTAALLALARRFAHTSHERTLRFVAFTNEEPPWFHTEQRGSRVYAKACKARGDDIVAMLSLETLGCYSDAENSQRYPISLLNWFYPSRGNFVAFVGNVTSRSLVREAIGTFRAHATMPSEGAALPSFVPGIGWSDHDSFWSEGYPGIMVTDTAVFRDPRYHTAGDVPDPVDFARLAHVVSSLEHVVTALANPSNAR